MPSDLTPKPNKKSSFVYLLGDSEKEQNRLSDQAKLWDPVATALMDRAGIKKGDRVLEIGPGAGSLHAELRKRVDGWVDWMEPSSNMRQGLEARFGTPPKDGMSWGTFLQETELPENRYDIVFMRWVFLFMPNPLERLKQLFGTLRPGGKLLLEDYHRPSFGLIPKPEHWDDFIAADRDFFASQGGDASIGSRLPGLMSEAGFKVVEVQPHFKTGHPGSQVWDWVTRYSLGVLSDYAQFAPFDAEKAETLAHSWVKLGQNPTTLLIAPTLLDIVGQKPSE